MGDIQSKTDTLSSWVRTAIFLLAIYSYFAGWIYTYHLYGHFGLSLNAIDIPPYFFFMYAYFAMPPFSYLNLVIATTGGAAIVLMLYIATRPRFRWIGAAILLSIFPLLAYNARTEAAKTSARIRAEFITSVSFVFKPDVATKYPRTFLAHNRDGLLRMLTETKDRFYVLFQNPGGDSLPIAHVYNVAKSDVLLATIDPPNIRRPAP